MMPLVSGERAGYASLQLGRHPVLKMEKQPLVQQIDLSRFRESFLIRQFGESDSSYA